MGEKQNASQRLFSLDTNDRRPLNPDLFDRVTLPDQLISRQHSPNSNLKI